MSIADEYSGLGMYEGPEAMFASTAAFNHQHRRRLSWLLEVIPTLQNSEPPIIVLQTFASSLYAYLIFSSYGYMVSALIIQQIGTTTASVSEEVAEVQRLMQKCNLSYSMHSAGTTVGQ